MPPGMSQAVLAACSVSREGIALGRPFAYAGRKCGLNVPAIPIPLADRELWSLRPGRFFLHVQARKRKDTFSSTTRIGPWRARTSARKEVTHARSNCSRVTATLAPGNGFVLYDRGNDPPATGDRDSCGAGAGYSRQTSDLGVGTAPVSNGIPVRAIERLVARPTDRIRPGAVRKESQQMLFVGVIGGDDD